MCHVEDLRAAVSPTMWIADPAEKKAAREKRASGYLPAWGAAAERQLGDGPFFAGEAMHVVDLKLYLAVRWFVDGHLDHIPATVFAGLPKLTRVHDAARIRAHLDTIDDVRVELAPLACLRGGASLDQGAHHPEVIAEPSRYSQKMLGGTESALASTGVVVLPAAVPQASEPKAHPSAAGAKLVVTEPGFTLKNRAPPPCGSSVPCGCGVNVASK